MGLKDISHAKFGDHFSFIFKNESQLFSVIIPFLIKGLENNEKCIYIIDETPKDKVLAEFSKKLPDFDKIVKSGQLAILNSNETYLKNGFFDPERTMNLWQQTVNQSMQEGYTGVRVLGEASWVNKNVKGTSRLIEYESELHEFFKNNNVCAICLYDERIISPKILAESIHCHPLVIFYNKICENLYFSPEKFTGSDSKSFPAGAYELMKEDFTGNNI
ncbi:MAG: MEDS domain-containing protein [archaeon]